MLFALRCSRVVSVAGLLSLLLSFPAAGAQLSPRFPDELQPLLLALKKARFRVLLEPPPIQGAYGATDGRRKTIWIAPISIDLGIVRQTLIHEAVHAVQSCPNGKLKPLGLEVPVSYKIDREISGLLYRGYAHSKFEIEREAFAMQGQPDAPGFLIRALAQRCR